MDLMEIGAEEAKEHEMTIEQSENEVHYKHVPRRVLPFH